MFFRSKRRPRYYPRETVRRDRRALSAPPRRRRKRGLWKLLGDFCSWFLFLLLISGSLLAGGLYLLHTRFDEAIRTHVEAKFQQAYPGHDVVVRAARRVEGQGIELRGLSIAERNPEGQSVPMLAVDELLLQCNVAVEELLAGKLDARQIVLRRLKVHAVPRPDGSWNLASLLPLPSFGSRQLPLVVEGATVELQTPGDTTRSPIALSIPHLKLTPGNAAAVSAGPAASPANLTASAANLTASAAGPTDSPAGLASSPAGPVSPPAHGAPAPGWSLEATLSHAHVQRIQLTGEYNVASQIWRAEGEVVGLHLGKELARSVPAEYQQHCRLLPAVDLLVEGRFQATNEQAGNRWCRFAVTGRVEGRFDDERLPVPVTDVKATFTSDGRSLEINQFSARAGQAMLSGNCTVGGFAEDSPCSLAVTAQRLLIDRSLVASLPEDFRQNLAKVAPEGLVDIKLQLEFDGREVEQTAEIECHDVSFAFHKFPYRLTNGQGRVLWRDRTLTCENFQASASGRPVRIEGEVHDPGPNYTGHVEVSVDEALPIDDRLIAALPDAGRRVMRQLSPHGAVTVWARFEQRGGNPPLTRKVLKLGLQDCSTTYELFRYPLTKIRGAVTMEDDQWTLKDLEGVNDSAWVLCNGGWGPDEQGILRLALNFTATDVPLADELRDALRPEAQNVWNSLQPRGTLDKVEAKVLYDGQSRKTSVDVTAIKQAAGGNVPGRTISVRPVWLPYQLDDMEGIVRYHQGITEWKGVRGRHGTATVVMDGSAQTMDDGLWTVHIDPLHVDRLEMSRELEAALPRRLGEAVSRLNISGPVSSSGNLVLRGRHGNSSPVSTQWDLDFDMENGGLHCGVRLDHIHGGLKLAGTLDSQGLSSHGWLDVDSLVYQGIQCTRLEGPISLNDERLGLGEWITRDETTPHSRPLNGRLFGGELRGSGEVMLSGDFPFQVETRMFNADLATISREATSQRLALSGKTYADLRLAGNGKGAHTFKGAGNVQLRDADVYELPVMVDLLKILKIKRPDRTAFTSSDVQYHVEGDRIYFDSIHFDGEIISLDGSGDMTLEKALNLTFHTSLGSNDVRDIILRPLLKEAGKQLLEIKVTGTLDNPLVNSEPLRNIRENIQNIFPGTSPSTRPAMSRLPQPGEPLLRGTPPR